MKDIPIYSINIKTIPEVLGFMCYWNIGREVAVVPHTAMDRGRPVDTGSQLRRWIREGGDTMEVGRGGTKDR